MKFVKTTVDTKHDKKAVFEHRGQFYLYSYVWRKDFAPHGIHEVHETMVFQCDENGEDECYSDVEADSGYIASAVMMERVRRNIDSVLDSIPE